MEKVTDHLIEILKSSTIQWAGDTYTLQLPKQLDRNKYLMVKKALERINGEWKRNAHVFNYDPTEAIARIIRTKALPEKNPTAFFPTPADAVQKMFDFLDEEDLEYAPEYATFRVLEPSAGSGAIADAIREKIPHAVLDTVEFFEPNQDILRAKGYQPHAMSFLDYSVSPDERYNLIMMNPPFSVKGDKNAFDTHVRHAFSLLKPFGEIVAILPTGWIKKNDKKSKAFRDFVSEYGTLTPTEILEEGTFKGSGTNIETCIIHLMRDPWKEREYSGYATFHEWNFAMQTFNTAAFYADFSKIVSSTRVSDDQIIAFVDNVIYASAKEYNFITTKFYDRYIKMIKDRVMDVREDEGINDEETTPVPPVEEEKEAVIPMPKPASKKKKKRYTTPSLFDAA